MSINDLPAIMGTVLIVAGLALVGVSTWCPYLKLHSSVFLDVEVRFNEPKQLQFLRA